MPKLTDTEREAPPLPWAGAFFFCKRLHAMLHTRTRPVVFKPRDSVVHIESGYLCTVDSVWNTKPRMIVAKCGNGYLRGPASAFSPGVQVAPMDTFRAYMKRTRKA